MLTVVPDAECFVATLHYLWVTDFESASLTTVRIYFDMLGHSFSKEMLCKNFIKFVEIQMEKSYFSPMHHCAKVSVHQTR